MASQYDEKHLKKLMAPEMARERKKIVEDYDRSSYPFRPDVPLLLTDPFSPSFADLPLIFTRFCHSHKLTLRAVVDLDLYPGRLSQGKLLKGKKSARNKGKKIHFQNFKKLIKSVPYWVFESPLLNN